jgi:plasmid stabilization system protein ParE
MNFEVHIRPEAEIDVDEATTWYEKQRKGLGPEFLDEFWKGLERIQENPYLYSVVYRNTRRVLVRRFPFAIYYRIEHNSLIVVAVNHGSRDPQSWRGRV